MESFQELPIGIDLGTTYSCIGVYRNGSVEIIPNEIGDRTTPSIVCFNNDEILTGEYIRNQKIQNPTNTIYAIKRIIGRNFTDQEVQQDIKNWPFKVEQDSENRPKIIIKNNNEEKSYFPQDISALVLKKLKKSADSFLGQSINKVVITVPAYFTESQKQATIDAAKIAGLEVLRIINEPTAAALAYGLNDKYKNKKSDNILNQSYITRTNTEATNRSFENDDEDKKILVFDLGGGTLDVTLLNMNDGICEMKSHSGCMHLGGEDFDNKLLNFFIDEFKKRTSVDLNDPKYVKAKKRLKEESERAKRILSNEEEMDLDIANLAEGRDFLIKVTRAKFNFLCDDLFKKCLEPINSVLKDAGWSRFSINDVVLVGGSTRIPKIQSIISEFFNGKKLCKNLNPDEAVAYGATIQAAIIMGMCEEDYAMLDVCPFSLGIAIKFDPCSKDCKYNENGDLFSSIIIPRGSPLPIEKEQIYRPVYDYQESAEIEIYEGEKKLVKNNHLLGKFILTDLPHKKKEDVKINVNFLLNEDSILTVTAKTENNSKSITIINNKNGLSKEEIQAAENDLNNCDNNDAPAAVAVERNYIKEINELRRKIDFCCDNDEQFNILLNYIKVLEDYLSTFNKNEFDNVTLKEKYHYYLSQLFIGYNSMLFFHSLIDDGKRDEIKDKVLNYVEVFKSNSITFLPCLVEIFRDSDERLFSEFCLTMVQCYSEKGTEKLNEVNSDDKKIANHYFYQALMYINKYSLNEKFKGTEKEYIMDSIYKNCIESVNLLNAEHITILCPNLNKNELISGDYSDDQLIYLYDKLNESYRFIKNSVDDRSKEMKAIYLANIVKIEFKYYNSLKYTSLIKKAETSIELIKSTDKRNLDFLKWYTELNQILNELKQKETEFKSEGGTNQEQIVQDKIKNAINEINSNFKKGNVPFIEYILNNHPYMGQKNIFTHEKIKNDYSNNAKNFVRKLRIFYRPDKYPKDSEDNLCKHLIMRQISSKLNDIYLILENKKINSFKQG